LSNVFNIGSEEQVSINQMIDLIENISGHKFIRNYQLDKPKGVRGRSSDNELIRTKLGWNTKVSLADGIRHTYNWIYQQITLKINNNKFARKY
jgi:nucleoside-diphosphate-sugar epimerase